MVKFVPKCVKKKKKKKKTANAGANAGPKCSLNTTNAIFSTRFALKQSKQTFQSMAHTNRVPMWAPRWGHNSSINADYIRRARREKQKSSKF